MWQPCYQVWRPYAYSLFVLDLWVITFPIGYHWKCICGHCACAESRDPWVGGQKQLHFWNTRPQFAYSLYNFYGAMTTNGFTLTNYSNKLFAHVIRKSSSYECLFTLKQTNNANTRAREITYVILTSLDVACGRLLIGFVGNIMTFRRRSHLLLYLRLVRHRNRPLQRHFLLGMMLLYCRSQQRRYITLM